ncbi:hypothetical protein D0T51_03185 [Parabacteroides sp. 52]|uniref:lipocalin family protein n=1 Tax=unclassified Parabacteroides TaxID=2649774 RepID=UPI0013D35AF8|nr:MULTISPECIES: lipocalin family protein [unclassified Parabacteroides]MDH6533998.1 hypothetical protein [Parabacteroides sp. PM5-20]NDV54739.1 hypothetical protein [Parabacteroides sp. 52]
MKRSVSLIISVLICGVFFMTGCDKQEPNLEGVENIIGCWVANPESEYDADSQKLILSYQKVKTLPTDSPSVKFLSDGTLIERKNASWCGTPPITYGDFSGSWKIENDNDIKIDVTYWGGSEQKTWKIINITGNTMKVEINIGDIQYN